MGKKKPGRKRGSKDTFLGRSGQLAVMAELMQRECNAAVPEIDLGTDVFAFRDDREEVARIQVKTNSNPHLYKDGNGYSAKFAIPLKQLEQPKDRPALYFALAVRLKGKWVDFLIVSRTKLKELHDGDRPFGSPNRTTGDLEITVEFRAEVTCSGMNWTDYRNAWHLLPPLQLPPSVAALEQGGVEQAGGPLLPQPPGAEPPHS